MLTNITKYVAPGIFAVYIPMCAAHVTTRTFRTTELAACDWRLHRDSRQRPRYVWTIPSSSASSSVAKSSSGASYSYMLVLTRR